MSDLPQLSNAAYASNSFGLGTVGLTWGGGGSTIVEQHQDFRSISPDEIFLQHTQLIEQPQPQIIMPARRIVQVFIADPNENAPLAESVIYTGEQKLTDSTDQELFFEINLAPKLEEYNKKRVTWPDKEASKRAGKEIFLEPVRIRDLRMVVVDIAKF